MTFEALLKKNTLAALLHGLRLALNFLLIVALARILMPEQLGYYSYVISLVMFLSMPAEFGLSQLVIRETTRLTAEGKWARLKGLWRWANQFVGVTSLAFGLLGVGIAVWLAPVTPALRADVLLWGLLLVPLNALGSVRAGALRGLERLFGGMLPEYVIRPGLLLLIVLAAATVTEITAEKAMVFHVMTAAVAFLMGAIYLQRVKPQAVTAPLPPTYDRRSWLHSAIAFGLMNGSAILIMQVDLLVLGAMATSEDVGIYKATAQMASLVAFGLTAINLAAAPYYSKYANQPQILQRLAYANVRIAGALAAPVLLAFWFMGDSILALCFGSAFERGYSVLVILAIGQMVNVATGSVGLLLAMTGYEKAIARITLWMALGNGLLAVLLIPLWGIEGAAAASTVITIVNNLLQFRMMRRSLRIDSSLLGAMSLRTERAKGKRPNFFIIGFEKCGTSALAAWLLQHPAVFMPWLKEPHFFCRAGGCLHRAWRDVAHYERLFANATSQHETVGEASVDYIYADGAVPALLRYAPQAKLIVMLRNPVDMAVSLHADHLAAMQEDEKDFSRAWALQAARARGLHVPSLCIDPDMLQYAKHCRLGLLVERLLQAAPREQCHFIFFEDLKTAPQAAWQAVLEFLDLANDGRTEFPVIRAAAVRTRKNIGRWILQIHRLKNRFFPHFYYGISMLGWLDCLTLEDIPPSPLAPEMRARLTEHFRPDVEKLAALLGRDLSCWLRAYDVPENAAA
ncbi:MAG: oligosaccharide flippase family protein [Alphaproteobacteria bacterium]